MPLRALYVDFNSYFASVEQQRRPELRGKPVAVLPLLADTTCCIAASYEARKFGVKTGTLVREAKRLCPDIRFVKAQPAVYVDYHHQLVEVVETCAHVERVLSIDEMYCELIGRMQQRDTALALANKIKLVIADKVGTELRCSIGIAPNVFLAKTASDMQKPDGLTVIEENDLPDCLFGLELRELCGIGEKMEKRLNASSVHDVETLCKSSKSRLRQIWGGIGGEQMHARLRGAWIPDLETQRSSIGHAHVLPPALRSHRAAYAVLHRLLQKAAMRLRSYGLITGALRVRIKRVDGSQWEHQTRLDPTQDTLQLLNALKILWADYPVKSPTEPLTVAVTLIDLDEQTRQSKSLFDNIESRNKLNAMLDALNLRYGKNTIYFGGAHLALESAPMRIAFNHIPDPVIEGDG